MSNDTRRTISERVYEGLRASIVNAEYPPGSKLTERNLAEIFCASRSSIRYAIHRLVSDGLLDQIPGKGVKIAYLSLEEAINVLYVREALEGMATRLAAINITTLQLQELEKIWEHMKIAINTREYLAYLRYAPQFHDLIVNCAGNDYIRFALEAAKVKTLRFSSNILLSGKGRQMIEGHADILNSLKKHDENLAEKSARSHVRLIMDCYRIINDLPPKMVHLES